VNYTVGTGKKYDICSKGIPNVLIYLFIYLFILRLKGN